MYRVCTRQDDRGTIEMRLRESRQLPRSITCIIRNGKKYPQYWVENWKEEYDKLYINNNRVHLTKIVRDWNAKKFGASYPTWWLCDLCNRPIFGKNLHLDHDHKTGKFRG